MAFFSSYKLRSWTKYYIFLSAASDAILYMTGLLGILTIRRYNWDIVGGVRFALTRLVLSIFGTFCDESVELKLAGDTLCFV